MDIPQSNQENRVLTVEGIIRSTDANPDRAIYQQSTFCENIFSFVPDINLEALIVTLNTEMPNAVAGFNNQQIKLHDTTNLQDTIDKAEWLQFLKNTKWYGPFYKPGKEQQYYFQTASDTGVFGGLVLWVWVEEKHLLLSYLKDNTIGCGKPHIFNNNSIN